MPQVIPKELKKFQDHKAEKKLRAKAKAAGEDVAWSRIRPEAIKRANEDTIARNIERWQKQQERRQRR